MSVACLVLVLAACAEAPKKVLDVDLAGALDQRDAPSWPSREQALPRYLFAGELTGEANFTREEPQRSGLVRALAWLAGLGLKEEEPRVLQRPQGGAVDEAGRVYVTDVSRQAVYVFDRVAGELRIWEYARPGVRFIAPIGITLAADGEVLVADAEHAAVLRLGPDGRPLGSFGEGILVRPTGIARDPATGTIYVADTRANDIKVFDAEGQLLDTIGRHGDGRGDLNAPTYISFAHDRLYVTDTLNSRIQIFNREGETLEMFGQRGLYVGNLTRPKGVAVDDEGNIYVVESYYDYVLIFDSQGRYLLPIGGTGHQPGQFYLPAGIWTDRQNRVYVADMFNGRVVILQYLGGA